MSSTGNMLKGLPKALADVLDKSSPYQITIFMSFFLILASIFTGREVGFSICVFLYSLIGLVLRYIKNDSDNEKYAFVRKDWFWAYLIAQLALLTLFILTIYGLIPPPTRLVST